MNLLRQVKKHHNAEPFLDPVNLEQCPNYLSVVPTPMDLSTVESKLKSGAYATTTDFGNDIRLIWLNSYKYNAGNPIMYQATLEMSQFFENNFRGIENLPLGETSSELSLLKQKVTELEAKVSVKPQNRPPGMKAA